MRVIYTILIFMIAVDLSLGSSSEFFNLTLTMPPIEKVPNNHSIYIAMELPKDEELYIADFHPIYNRQKIRSITTYLCSKPYLPKQHFWFEHQPCYSMDLSMIIYEWHNSIPAVQWPQDAGFRVGMNTPYRYVVLSIQYYLSVIDDTYGEQLTMTRTKPKYKIGTYEITTDSLNFQDNRADFSCRYYGSSIQIFSVRSDSNPGGRGMSLYRLRNNQIQTIIKANLHWPETFYQLPNSVDIKTNDYIIGTCTYEKTARSEVEYSTSDLLCQMTVMFWMKQEEKMSTDGCEKNDYPQIIERFLPMDNDDVPQTLYDINPIYPKVTPDQWAIMNANISDRETQSNISTTNTLYLTYSKNQRHEEIIRLLHTHKILLMISIWILLLILGFVILFIIIHRSRKVKRYVATNKARSKAITVGGESSSLSGWLTKRRFQYHEDDHNGESEPLTEKRRWASESDESGPSDTEVFNSTDFRNVILRN